MHIKTLYIRGYRCIGDLTMHCNAGLNVIAGENNVGKSNLLNALRLPFQRRYGFQDVPLTEEDFHRNRAGKRDTDEIAIDIEFDGLSGLEKGYFHTCIPAGKEQAEMHFRAKLAARDDGSSRVNSSLSSGDGENAAFDYNLLQEFEVVLLGALRNVTPELEPGRRSLVARRLQKFASEETKGRLQHLFGIAAKFTRKEAYLQEVEAGVQRELYAIEGNGPLRTGIDLLLGDPEFRQVASTLRFLLRDHGGYGRWEVDEVGLGYANVLYIAAVLSELQEACRKRHLCLPLLLIEEPEAHLHPQLLQRLAAYLSRPPVEPVVTEQTPGQVSTEQPANADTNGRRSTEPPVAQVFVTTHSPILTAGTKLDCMHILQESDEGKRSLVSFATSGLGREEKETLERYLDATKSQLFFAQGVILVEGISEVLLIPKLAELVGKRISDYEVAIVNVGGCSFEPFVKLFGDGALNRPCAVVTDSDPPDVDKGGFDFTGQIKQPRLSPRADRCMGLRNLPNVDVFMSTVTLEFDLAHAGLADLMATIIQGSYERPPDDLPALVRAESNPVAKAALVYRGMPSRSVITKAELAQRLALRMDTASLPAAQVPDYLRRAIEHVCRDKAKSTSPTEH